MNAITHARETRSSLILHLLPTIAALGYPWYLSWFASEVAIGNTVVAAFAMLVVFGIPATAFASFTALSCAQDRSRRSHIVRLASLATIATPSLYVLLGVVLYMMKINDADKYVWSAGWTMLLTTVALGYSIPESSEMLRTGKRDASRIRVLHGVSAALLLVVFLMPHLVNHSLGIFGNDLHKAMQHVIRYVYLNKWVQPGIVGLMLFQVLSGLFLVSEKMERKQDFFVSLQIASGSFLLAFIPCHMNSVFTLARHFGTETDYVWATNQPVGLIRDAWSTRLIPHYSVGVIFLLCHAICGVRTVMLAHNVDVARANRICGGLIALAFTFSLVIIVGMVGVRV
ncbi:hypothetical protein [Caballeronia sp. LZ043]|uniref:hypothetical protein n=1 Tax=Caballeronia sp. LZ043 TaxID=3038569 RepID=UPI0028625C71|nr:hypothetical protein [Caballeronia sp. LZ043]MDR5823629.1 hypothetical protein [Caballeronia sp. LZ043]